MNDVFQAQLQQAIDLLVKSTARELPFSEDVINIASKASSASGFLTEGAFKEACENNPLSNLLNFTKFAASLSGGSVVLDFSEWTDPNNQYATDSDSADIGPGILVDAVTLAPPQGRFYVIAKFRVGDSLAGINYPNNPTTPAVFPTGVAAQAGWYYSLWNDDNSSVETTFAGTNPVFSVPLVGGCVINNRAPLVNGQGLGPFYNLKSVVFHVDGTVTVS